MDILKNMKSFFFVFFTAIVMLMSSNAVVAQEGEIQDTTLSMETASDTHQELDMNDPVTALMHHIADSYGFHIASIGDKHFTVELPMIIYNLTNKKWDVFMSSKFHHGHEAYNG